MNYFGDKLVLISTLNGIPLIYSLVPASTDERFTAGSVLEYVRACRILADKRFIVGQWQTDISKTTGNQIYSPKLANQLQQQPKTFEGLLNNSKPCKMFLDITYYSFSLIPLFEKADFLTLLVYLDNPKNPLFLTVDQSRYIFEYSWY